MPQNSVAVPFFLTGNPDNEEYTTLPYPGMLGMTAWFEQGTPGASNLCKYRLVKAFTSITPILGGVCVWSTRGAFTVTDVVTNAGLVAGISPRLCTAAAVYFWMLVYGDKSVRFIDSPTSACATTGNPAIVSSTTAKADALALATAIPAGFIGNCTSAQDGTTKLATVRIRIADQF